jgi:hypothetical protein
MMHSHPPDTDADDVPTGRHLTANGPHQGRLMMKAAASLRQPERSMTDE